MYRGVCEKGNNNLLALIKLKTCSKQMFHHLPLKIPAHVIRNQEIKLNQVYSTDLLHLICGN